jgi:chromosome segregation ATPase
VSKKIIIITAAAGLVSFAAAFGLSFMRSKKAAQIAAEQQAKELARKAAEQSEQDKIAQALGTKDTNLALTEKQLEGLIYDVRDKIREYNKRMKELTSTEERVKIAQAQLKKDIEELADLRTELASTVAALKQEHERLLKSRIEIKESEQQNLASIAATYDKMNATGAAEIFTNMSRLDTDQSKGLDDVVKILYYMNDRTKAKVLAELVNTEPKLAAVLSQELKRIREVAQ